MPVNLDPSNSIIKSFVAGRQLRQDKEETQYKKDQDYRAAQERDRLFKEQVRQYDEKLAQDLEEFKLRQKAQAAVLESNQITQRNQAMELALKGITPSGYSPTIKRSIPGGAEFQQYFRMNPQTMQDESFEVPTQETYARKQADIARIAGAPETEQKVLLEQIKRLGELGLKDEERKYQESRDLRNQTFELNRDQQKYLYDLNIEREKAKLKNNSEDTNIIDLAKMAIINPDILTDPKLLTANERGKVIGKLSSMGVDFATKQQENVYNIVNSGLNSLNEIKTHPGYSTGIIGMAESKIPGTSSYAFNKKLQQLKTNLTLPNLDNLRGLGAMSDREFNALQSAITTLDIGLPKKDFQKELTNVEITLNSIKTRIEQRTKVNKINSNLKTPVKSLEDITNEILNPKK